VALGDPRLDEAALGAGVAAAKWPARFQRVSQGPLAALAGDSDLWLDGAHNPHAARALARLIGDLATRDGRPVALIVGLLGRKDANGFFAAFTDLAPHVVATSFASPSATPPEVLVAAARNVGLEAEAAAGVEDAIGRARRASGAPGHIVVCGSLHFAGDVLALSPETWPT
jgi:dihydrofolate synthase/folylpolyglutamate synthase